MSEAYKGPAIVDLMGHLRMVGFVEEVSQYGTTMLRIDIPSDPPQTHFCGGSSIYRMTPTTEEVVAKANEPPPVFARFQLTLAEPTTPGDPEAEPVRLDDIPW